MDDAGPRLPARRTQSIHQAINSIDRSTNPATTIGAKQQQASKQASAQRTRAVDDGRHGETEGHAELGTGGTPAPALGRHGVSLSMDGWMDGWMDKRVSAGVEGARWFVCCMDKRQGVGVAELVSKCREDASSLARPPATCLLWTRPPPNYASLQSPWTNWGDGGATSHTSWPEGAWQRWVGPVHVCANASISVKKEAPPSHHHWASLAVRFPLGSCCSRGSATQAVETRAWVHHATQSRRISCMLVFSICLCLQHSIRVSADQPNAAG